MTTTYEPGIFVTESDLTEVVGALEDLSKVINITGDKVIARHYRNLGDRLDAQDLQHPLVVAYHAVFDIKDAAPVDSPARYKAYEACSRLAALMTEIGVLTPERYDAPREDQS